jgi:acyl carrier protein
MTLTYADLARFIEDELAVDAELGEGTLLFSSGLIDSFSLVSLMSFIEEEGGVRIAPSDVKLENFDSIERILAYLARATAEA